MSCIKAFTCILRQNNIGNPLIQQVRFRKPRWLPIAKSKEFYVREPTPIDPEEDVLLREKYKHYRSTVKSIRHYLKAHLSENNVDKSLKQGLDEAANIKWMEEQAMEWNEKVAVLREERQNQDMRLEAERLQRKMEEQADKRLQESLTAERRIHVNKMASESFITEENIDIEIGKMLDNRNDYNFALTNDGKIWQGEYPDRQKDSAGSR